MLQSVLTKPSIPGVLQIFRKNVVSKSANKLASLDPIASSTQMHPLGLRTSPLDNFAGLTAVDRKALCELRTVGSRSLQ